MHIEQIKLANNLETLFIDSHGSTAASVQIWFRAGSALENTGERGIAHFLEHMFFKGTKTRPGAKIAHEVESFGGEINAFTSFDYTCYYINTPNNHLNETVAILLDMVSNPEFANDELIPERDVVFEEYRRSEDSPSQFGFKKLQSQCFTGGYSHQILGTEQTIKNFTREQVVGFRERYYNLENCMLVIAGDSSKYRSKIIKTIESHKMPSGPKTVFPKFHLKAKDSTDIHQKDVRQSTLTIAIDAPNYSDPSTAAEDLAINCLGHGETSRLYNNLINKTPLASSLSASTMYFSHGGAHFLRFAFPSEDLEKICHEVISTLKDVNQHPFTNEEVTKIKNQYIASKVYERESIEAFAFSLGHGFAQTGDIFCENEFIDRLKKANSLQVNQSLQAIFNRKIHLNLQTPKDYKNNKAKLTLENFSASLKNIFSKNAHLTPAFTLSKFDESTKLIQLKNGMQLIYRYNNMTPTFVMHAYLKGGMMAENTINAGLHQLLSRTFTYGNAQTKYEELKNDLERLSASLNGFSGKNAYGLTMHGQSEHSTVLFNHFIHTFLTPTLPTKYINLEKKLIKRSLENQKEDPVKQCFKAFNKLIFNKHHYSQDIIGNEKTLKILNRELLGKTHLNHLKKSEVLLTFCGDITIENLLDLLKPLIESIPHKKTNSTKLKSAKPILGENIHIPFQREQAHIFIGTDATNFTQTEDNYVKMLTTYLSGQSSELFVEVRDKQGLCYSVQPVHHSALEAGYWGIYIGTGQEKTTRAIEAINAIIKRISKEGLPQKEFNRIKKMIDGQNLLNIQTNDDYANLYSISTLHGLGLDHQHHSHEFIRNAEYENFQRFTKSFLSQKWNTIIVGN